MLICASTGYIFMEREKIEPKELIEKSLLLLRGYQRGMDLYEEDYEEYIMKK